MFRFEGIRILRTPIRAPRANAFAERFVGTIWRECPDRMAIFSRRHLEAVVHVCVEHYNRHRPHRSFGQLPPQPRDLTPAVLKSVDLSQLKRTDRLGGVIMSIAWWLDVDDVVGTHRVALSNSGLHFCWLRVLSYLPPFSRTIY